MGKTITLKRHELVWETRANTWDEEEFNRHLEWLKGFKDRIESGECPSDSDWYKNHIAEYEVLSQYTWDEIVKIMKDNDYDNEPIIQYYSNGEPWYKEHSSDVIIEAMREDNYDSDVCDTNYADDYEEEFEYGED